MDKKTENNKPSIGLALGSGASRGWAHLGVLSALREYDIKPSIVCGTSIGSLVGAAYVSKNIDKLEQWVCSLTKLETIKFFEINTSMRGFVNTERFRDFLNEYVASEHLVIENVSKKFATVSTDMETGREVWFTEGPLLESVWASIALPGLFPAIRKNDRWLVDGGLVNPVPVSACRALGADVVIAVNLNGDIIGKHISHKKIQQENEPRLSNRFTNLIREYTNTVLPDSSEQDQPPGLFDAIATSVHIIQDRITRSRIAADPPDLLLAPKLSHIGLLEFYRGREAIEVGRKCVEHALPELMDVLSEN